MRLRVVSPVALALLGVTAACDGPSNTLSSDCHSAEYNVDTLCVVLDTPNCEQLAYNLSDPAPLARFCITFPTSHRLLRPIVGADSEPHEAVASSSSSSSRAVDEAVVTRLPIHNIAHKMTPAPSGSPDNAALAPSASPDSVTSGPSGTLNRIRRVDNNVGVSPSESSDRVHAIGRLWLDRAFTELRIVGGRNEFGTRGETVPLTIDRGMLARSPHVASLWIANCAIGDALSHGGLLSTVATGLTDLNLRNTRLQTEPPDLSVLANLRTLKMEQNYLSTLSSRVELPNLILMDVSENALTSFEAKLPALESLTVNNNNLNAIPDAVYAMPKLRELYLRGNPIAAIVVSASQLAFLSKLLLEIDQAPTPPPQPVVYVSNNATGDSLAGVALDDRTVDLDKVVSTSVGTLADLHGLKVWKLNGSVFDIFTAQQSAIAKATAEVVIGGVKAQTYQSAVAETVKSKTITPTPESNASSPPSTVASGDATLSRNPGSKESSANSTDDTAPTSNTPQGIKNQTATNSSATAKTLIASLASVSVAAAIAIGIVFARRRRRANAKASHDVSSTAPTPRDESCSASYEAVIKPHRPASVGSSSAAFDASQGPDVGSLLASRRIRSADLEDVRVLRTEAATVEWLVKLRGARYLSSKRLRVPTTNTERMTQFVNEIVIAADLEYPKIVRLVGVAWTSKSDLQALYEYMPNGDLESHLQRTSRDAGSWSRSKLQMAIDIVEGIVYTHSFNPPLLHRDLRARNILLDDETNPKLSNFGSARFASEQNTMTTDGIGSGRWLAPEILLGSTDYDAASDMYAFGVLLSEMDTHTMPYEDIRDSNGTAIVETQILASVARDELRPTLSLSCPPQIRDLVARCWAQDPVTRPSAMQVAYELRLLVREW